MIKQRQWWSTSDRDINKNGGKERKRKRRKESECTEVSGHGGVFESWYEREQAREESRIYIHTREESTRRCCVKIHFAWIRCRSTATRRLTTSKTGVPNVILRPTAPFGSQIDARHADSSLKHVSETSRRGICFEPEFVYFPSVKTWPR